MAEIEPQKESGQEQTGLPEELNIPKSVEIQQPKTPEELQQVEGKSKQKDAEELDRIREELENIFNGGKTENEDNPKNPEAEKAEAVAEAMEEIEQTKEVVSGILKEWAEKQNPPLAEGKDFIIPKIEEENIENTSPHEHTNVYFGFRQEHFHRVKKFFEEEYFDATKSAGLHNEWTADESPTKINYSWAGRFCIEGAGGPAIDTAPMQSIEPRICETHHR